MAGDKAWHEHENAVMAAARRLFDLTFSHRAEPVRDLLWEDPQSRHRWIEDARDMLRHAWEEATG